MTYKFISDDDVPNLVKVITNRILKDFETGILAAKLILDGRPNYRDEMNTILSSLCAELNRVAFEYAVIQATEGEYKVPNMASDELPNHVYEVLRNGHCQMVGASLDLFRQRNRDKKLTPRKEPI